MTQERASKGKNEGDSSTLDGERGGRAGATGAGSRRREAERALEIGERTDGVAGMVACVWWHRLCSALECCWAMSSPRSALS